MEKVMPPLNDLYMKWDMEGGYWYTSQNKNITPQEMLEYAAQLEAKLIMYSDAVAGAQVFAIKLKAENERLRDLFRAGHEMDEGRTWFWDDDIVKALGEVSDDSQNKM